MSSVMPMLMVDDLDVTLAFYRDVLGFTVTADMRAPDQRNFHGAVGDGDTLLSFGPASDLDGSAHASRGAGIILFVGKQDDDLDAYYDRVRSRGAPIVEAITDQPYGDRTFIVADPDGYQLCFYKTVNEFDPTLYADWQGIGED